MNDFERGKDGRLSRTLSNINLLIDRYIPTVTQETVREMTFRYEQQIFDLLAMIHEYRVRNEQILKRMDAMEREYYEKVAIPVSLGSFEASAQMSHCDMARMYSIEWRPERYHSRYVLSEQSLMNPGDTPHLFEMVGRQFEEHAKKVLIPKLRAEYMKLYDRFRP
ncbi:hypothetical protein CYK37_30030 [Mesorhizobium loti]|nr:hypothetical protein [Mesorhizobium loti]PLP55531.1 hypothetical protein CYK37_30030 [Mesorhizobium loti]